MARIRSDTLYGTLNLLILRALSGAELHGLEIRHRIREASDEVLKVDEGALYPALHRLKAEGLLRSEWRISEKRRRAKYYCLTSKGEKRLQREERRWRDHVAAVSHVLDGTVGVEGK